MMKYTGPIELDDISDQKYPYSSSLGRAFSNYDFALLLGFDFLFRFLLCSLGFANVAVVLILHCYS
jgi:hypothetical protein